MDWLNRTLKGTMVLMKVGEQINDTTGDSILMPQIRIQGKDKCLIEDMRKQPVDV